MQFSHMSKSLLEAVITEEEAEEAIIKILIHAPPHQAEEEAEEMQFSHMSKSLLEAIRSIIVNHSALNSLQEATSLVFLHRLKCLNLKRLRKSLRCLRKMLLLHYHLFLH